MAENWSTTSRSTFFRLPFSCLENTTIAISFTNEIASYLRGPWLTGSWKKELSCGYTSIYKWLWRNMLYPIIKHSSLLEPLICRDVFEELWASVLSLLKFSKIKMWLPKCDFCVTADVIMFCQNSLSTREKVFSGKLLMDEA